LGIAPLLSTTLYPANSGAGEGRGEELANLPVGTEGVDRQEQRINVQRKIKIARTVVGNTICP